MSYEADHRYSTVRQALCVCVQSTLQTVPGQTSHRYATRLYTNTSWTFPFERIACLCRVITSHRCFASSLCTGDFMRYEFILAEKATSGPIWGCCFSKKNIRKDHVTTSDNIFFLRKSGYQYSQSLAPYRPLCYLLLHVIRGSKAACTALEIDCIDNQIFAKKCCHLLSRGLFLYFFWKAIF